MINDFSFSISIPTDSEGFILLKCPICGELFKLKPEDFQDDSIFEIYCPGCGLVSENYITDDIVELAMKMAQNYAEDIIAKQLKKLEKQSKKGLIHFKVTNHHQKQAEQPIMLTISVLERKMYLCCKMEAKIKPVLKMSASYCPYCGVKDYGFE